MSFVKSEEELQQYYSLRDREFPEARMMGVMFGTDPEFAASLLPPPLEQADMPGGLMFIAEYGETNLGPGYREAALFLRCKYQGVAGSYCLSMPIDSTPSRMHNGRDIFGFPKKMAKIHFEHDENGAKGWVERNGVRFVELSVTFSGTLPDLPPTGPTYLFKASPRIDLLPGFDGPVLLASQQTDINASKVNIGTASMRFAKSTVDPWHTFADATPMMAFMIESSNVMRPGKILAEVDEEAFLPYYFKMADFYTGD